jgi:hypothetical protein
MADAVAVAVLARDRMNIELDAAVAILAVSGLGAVLPWATGSSRNNPRTAVLVTA